MAPHPSLFDGGGATAVAPAAFVAVAQFLDAHAARLAEVIVRQAVVSPQHAAGVAIAGYYRAHPARYPTQVWRDRAAALAWLDRAALAPTLAAIDHALQATDVLAALGRWLGAASLGAATLATAAAALDLPPRTLQRRLTERGTSFARERGRAQLARAQDLLLTSDDKLDAIAAAVGCASRSSLVELFRRGTGVTPAAWRAQHKL